ncbi:hypothetical protein ACOM2C_11000 [Pseudarthrobacter sp. So.54]
MAEEAFTMLLNRIEAPSSTYSTKICLAPPAHRADLRLHAYHPIAPSRNTLPRTSTLAALRLPDPRASCRPTTN